MQLIMQVLDADYFLKDGTPIVRIFGKKPSGATVCCMYEGFQPYFYCEYSSEAEKKAEELGLKYEVVQKKSALGYRPEPRAFLKVCLKNPQDVPLARAKFEMIAKCYESDILFKYRFMVDMGAGGMQWLAVDGERTATTTVKNGIETYKLNSFVPIENVANAPLRFLCIDIECLQLDMRRLPDAEKDPVIAVAMEFYPDYRGSSSLVLVSKPVVNPHTRSFADEKSMLENFLRTIEDYDPDIITGYNINGFDLPYLVTRLRKNRLPGALGRTDKPASVRSFADTKEVEVSGRVVVDVFSILKRDPTVRLHRYTLAHAAHHLLGEEKHEMRYTEIPEVWKKDAVRLVEYARQDASLAMKLLMKDKLMDKFVEIAKVSGVLLQDGLRGQSIRIENLVMREFLKQGIIIPQKPGPEEVKARQEQQIKGGAVLEPERGLHTEPTLVLDFQSLYPSIIKSYNISPDSIILGEPPPGAKYHTAPNGANFLDAEYYKGVFPLVVENLVKARREAKRLMATAKDTERRMLDARQYALKTLANSMYGFFGYARARLYISDVANAITAYGREAIGRSKKLVEEKFGVKVIYSDTDSLFVKPGISDTEKLAALAADIADYVSKETGLSLEFEKVYKTLLILTKKRYAGLKVMKVDGQTMESIDMRGIETVRRDWCSLVTETMMQLLEIMLREGDVQKATELVRGIIAEVYSGKTPLEKLTVYKGLTKPPSSYEGVQPHVELAKKLAARDPRQAPGIGDRIGYVIVKGKGLLSKRAEDPDYVRERGLQIDADYYVNSQLLPPTERIMQAAGVERTEILGAGRQVSIADMLAVPALACTSCGQTFRRMPLRGVCDCGGAIAGNNLAKTTQHSLM